MIKKFLITLITLPLAFNRRFRRRAINFLKDLSAANVLTFYRFVRRRPAKNSVLLIEANSCHGEVMAGYVKYFRTLGFDVDCLVHRDLKREKMFCRLDTDGVTVFASTLAIFPWMLKTKYLNRYKHVLVMSSNVYAKSEYIMNLYPELKSHPSLFMVEHELSDIPKYGGENFIRDNRLIVLGKLNTGIFVNPHLFGDVKITGKNDVPTFITVGAIRAFRKNHAELIDAIKSLAATGKKFRVIVVGNGKLNDLPREIKPFMEITGRLNFPDMFEKLESADFFLPLLDPDNPDHERYITTGVTGSTQLIYAFGKVPVLHKKFAKFYRFDDGNAIVYDDCLESAMLRAIDMTADEYECAQENLTQAARDIEMESLDNLRQILNHA
ncbi:MAG: glycosyltransferase family 4 protein [Rickettsiales bacterium]|jgi:glycosyltransferase involved in cell wall biosynthesis|nr:glycosyltransferase family 4 protein [Rickettsiales bacterium]